MEDPDDEDDSDISASHNVNIAHEEHGTHNADNDVNIGSPNIGGMCATSDDGAVLDVAEETDTVALEASSESDNIEFMNDNMEEKCNEEAAVSETGILANEDLTEGSTAPCDIGVISIEDQDMTTLPESCDTCVILPEDEDAGSLAETSHVGVGDEAIGDEAIGDEAIDGIDVLSNDDTDEFEDALAEINDVGVSDAEELLDDEGVSEAEESLEDDEYLELYGDTDDDEDEGIEILQATDNESYDDHSSSQSEDEDEDQGKKKATTFDTSLPSSHGYLGENMKELHGRTVHSEGETVVMPLFFQPGVVIAPGQTLPLNLFHPQPISMMKRVISADKTFGMMMSKGSHLPEERNVCANIGVTCEIYSVREDSVYGVDQMSLKCEGRQRFRILSKQYQMDGVILGKILILPDAPIPPYPKMSLIYSQHNRNSISSQVIRNNIFVKNNKWSFGEARYLAGFNPRHKMTICRSTAALHGWVYKLYNPYFLMDCLMNEIYSWNSNLNADSIPIDPTDFSHWITANLPLTNEMKIELLEIDSAILRLRRQIELMNKCTTTLACMRCKAVITDKKELFSLSRKGPMSAYVNPGGYVHETVTFYKAKNLALQGRPTTEYSWFPGYAWTVASCKSCHAHMGWKFNADKKGLQPTKFWGLTRAALKPVFKDVKDEENNKNEIQSNPMFSDEMYESNI